MELGGIIKKIWDDPTYKKEFLSDPKKKLEEEGLKVPENVKVIVHENTPDEIHLIVPNKPPGELSEEELASLSGGIIPLLAVGFGAIFDRGRSGVTGAEVPSWARKGE